MSEHTMRVLFVDDDPETLAALEVQLASLQPRWSMSFCDPEGAVDRLGVQLFDAVVARSRMRVISGVDLLARVRGSQPQATRIMVGVPALEQSALAVVHQVLPEPCEIAGLQAAIASGTSQREILSKTPVRSTIVSIGGLPAMPTLWATLSSMMDNPRVSMESIAALIEGDAGITARVLQVVNSAFFSRGKGITTVRQAITLMGVDVVRALVLTTEMFSMFDRGRTSTHFSLVDLAARSLQTAKRASKTAETDLKELVGPAFTAGVLRDVGQIVMATALPDMYDSAHLYASTKRVRLHQAEQLVLKLTHAGIGAYLLALWGLPDSIVDAVAFHHTPALAPSHHASLVQLIHDSDCDA
jgi:HD-like signal output (HDOD) protein/CheY-like chemotaxis protein